MAKVPKGPVGPIGPTNPIKTPSKLEETATAEGQTTHMLAKSYDDHTRKMAEVMYPTHRKSA